MWAFENRSSRKRKQNREKKLHGPQMGRYCDARCARLAGLLVGRKAAGCYWSGKRFVRTEKKRMQTGCRSSFPPIRVRERVTIGRGWPCCSPGGWPAAGMGTPWPTVPRGGGFDGGDASCASPASSALRPWREARVELGGDDGVG